MHEFTESGLFSSPVWILSATTMGRNKPVCNDREAKSSSDSAQLMGVSEYAIPFFHANWMGPSGSMIYVG